MIAEADLRAACWREHQAITRCGAACDREDGGSPALKACLGHHQIVLAALRALLADQYHAALHGTPPTVIDLPAPGSDRG